MTDQIPADKVREIAADMRAAMRRDESNYSDAKFLGDMSGHIRALEALLPPRPTLADMTPVARRECQWMQCEVNGEIRVITLIREGNDHAVTLAPSGFTFHCPPEKVTPRPDLPRMTWPSDTEAAPAPALALPDGWRLADHKDHGRVLVIGTDGENAVYTTPHMGTGIRTRLSLVNDLTFLDTDNDKKPEDVTTAQPGDVIESSDDPRIDALPVGSILLGRDEEAATKRRWAWTGLGHTPDEDGRDEFGPWTVLHIPKGADQ